MHDPEKSDSGIVAAKRANKAGRPVTEPAEPRPGTKGNEGQQRTHRAQTSVSMDVPTGHQVVKKAKSPSAMRRRISRPRVHKPSFALLDCSASRSANSR